MSSRFSVVSLFAGCGGSSLGYQMADGKVLLAVEWDDNAVQTYRLNFPDTRIYHGDIQKLTVESVMEKTGLKKGELDILDGSPPCQGFSTAGKRNYEDIRNQLFIEYVRILRGLMPKVMVMENVSGLVKGKMKLIFAEIMRELKASGYRVKCRLMNAMYYSVPQSRQRTIFIGVREDLKIDPSHPKPQKRPITVREAIGYLPVGDKEKHSEQVIDAWKKCRPGQSLRKAVRYVGSYQSIRLDPDRPSSTQIKAHFNWHYAVARQLNIKEATIIQGFTESYQWAGNKSNVRERIGNSVPPLFMKAIAEHIRDHILAKIEEPKLIEG